MRLALLAAAVGVVAIVVAGLLTRRPAPDAARRTVLLWSMGVVVVAWWAVGLVTGELDPAVVLPVASVALCAGLGAWLHGRR